MVFNATFNNISVITWQSVFFVEKTTNLPQATDKLITSVVRGTDCIGSCKSNYDTITTTMAQLSIIVTFIKTCQNIFTVL